MAKTYFGKRPEEEMTRRPKEARQQEYRQDRSRNSAEEYDPDYEPGRRHIKKKKRSSRRAVIFVVEILILVIFAVLLFMGFKIAKMQTVSIPKSEITVNSEIGAAEQKVLEDYTNIALFGVDSREGQLETAAHSDAILVASINNRTKEIRLASVYRDTYLDNTNGEYRKATECYYFGGASRAMSMLNKNLDLDIDKFVTVDFNVVADVVDLLGGIEIDVASDEVDLINGYQVESSQVTGKEIIQVAGPGLQTLNGLQTLSYCRIRYTTGDDYKRTERQRTVINKIFEKVSDMDLLTLNNIVDAIFPEIYTNLNLVDLLGLAKDVASYSMGETTGFPFDKTTGSINGASVVIPVNLAENVRQLHGWLFGSTDYTPSSTVQEISNTISNVTGVY